MTKRVLVTGAAGFIGSHVCDALLARGDTVVGLDNFDPYYDPACKRRNIEEIRSAAGAGAFRLIEGDVRDAALVAQTCHDVRFDAVVHLAALAGVRASIGQAKVYNDVNVAGSIHLLDAARDTGVGNFVFASTSSVYGETDAVASPAPFREDQPCDRPLAPYPATKRAVELFGHAYHNVDKLNFTALRFFTVYGPRNRPDMMAFKLLDSITRGKTVPLYNGGAMRRDWTFVKDIAAGVVAAVDRPLGYEIINLGRGEPVLLSDFVQVLEKLAGGKATVESQPMPAADVTFTYADVSKARRLLGYAPQTSMQDGASALWQWFRHAAP